MLPISLGMLCVIICTFCLIFFAIIMIYDEVLRHNIWLYVFGLFVITVCIDVVTANFFLRPKHIVDINVLFRSPSNIIYFESDGQIFNANEKFRRNIDPLNEYIITEQYPNTWLFHGDDSSKSFSLRKFPH